MRLTKGRAPPCRTAAKALILHGREGVGTTLPPPHSCIRDGAQDWLNTKSKGIVTTQVPHTPSVRANRLAREKSPYLLQHQHNPVDWYPWGEEAFARARGEGKPIFLSIGYSTCHWCHVMERESFEDEDLARFLNAHFINIKVDREERPDVDKIYMTFVQAATGQGGWPLNVFLTPALQPFFGGTYFPPDSRYGRPSFLEVLEQVRKAWEARHDALVQSAKAIQRQLSQATQEQSPTTRLPGLSALRHAGTLLKQSYDPEHGGFGGPPKFPQPSQAQFLMRYAARFGDAEAARMVLRTCDKMAAGGIHDQLGGGFARYSVDAQWLVPHFEKMLYDNAQLAQLYLDAFVVSGRESYAQVVRDILSYILRDMTDPGGGFYSAEDADSEGHEGKFYCWTKQEVASLLTAPEFEVGSRYFGLTEQANFVDHSHPHPLPNQNVLSVVDPNLRPGEEELLRSAKRKLFEARSRRVRPHRDDKVLTSWNGLMLGVLARAYAVLGDAAYRAAAEKCLAFLRKSLWDAAPHKLYHRWRDGERDRAQLVEDYAFLLGGVIELYEATLAPAHLAFARDLADAMLDKFFDRANGGFWQSGLEASDLILRLKEDYDGAEPSGNSVAALALLKLGKIAGVEAYTEAAEKTLRLFAQRFERLPQAATFMLQALDFALEEPPRAVVAGDPEQPQARALVRAVHSVYRPNKVVLGNAGLVEPYAAGLAPKEGPVLYLCTGTACLPPTSDPAAAKAWMRLPEAADFVSIVQELDRHPGGEGEPTAKDLREIARIARKHRRAR